MAHLRFPHLHGETLVFIAEDDVWTAPLAGGRAYRLTADAVPVATPRISPDGTRVAWASRRDGAREAYVADIEGGAPRRLTYWGDPGAMCAGWTPDGEVVSLTATEEPTGRRWAYAIPGQGGAPRRLPYGPLAAVAFAPGSPAERSAGGTGISPVVLQTGGTRDAAWWKRYRGGTAGRIWLDAAGTGDFTRFAAELDGQLECPMLVRSAGELRVAFLSDHEGWGNLYSIALDGTGLRRHSDHGSGDHGSGDHGSDRTSGDAAPAFYVRHASTDGERVVYESAGRLWIVDSLDAATMPRRLDVVLGGPRSARVPFRARITRDLGPVRPDAAGRTSITTVRGTVHRLTHRDGPSRTLLAEPGVRARLAHPLGRDRAVWVDDALGEDAVCVAPLDDLAEDAPQRRRHGAGELGRVLELVPAPDGSAVALTTHDGRLLLLDLARTAPGPADSTDPGPGPTDSGPTDSGPTDSGPTDSGPTDSGPTDSGPTDSGPTDSGPTDSGPTDSGPTDSGPTDSDPADSDTAGPADSDPAAPAGSDPKTAGATSAGATDGTLRELARGTAGELADLCWSPDSAWLAFCDPPEPGLSRIVLARVSGGELVEVTPARFHDSDPVFTSDGKYLAFLSRRVFDPSYDHHAFDLAFQSGWKPFLVPLAARTPSPFGASPDGRPVTPGGEGPEDPPAPARENGGSGQDEPDPVREKPTNKAKKAPPEVVVDVDGLPDRVVGIPVEAGNYVGMTAGKGALLWLRYPASGVLGDSRADEDAERERPWLERYDLSKRSLTTIADPGGAFAVSGDGTRVVLRDRATLRLLRTDRSGSSAPSEDGDGSSDEFDIDTRRLVVTVDPTAEWRQMFDETARLMRDHFWVADMAGVDWAAEVARYRPLVDELGSYDDLIDLLWELQGELGTSHAYVVGAHPAGDATGRPGLLGADLEPGTDGGWRVRRVLPPESSAPAARSPLSGPGVDVRAGDLILEVGGEPVDPDWGAAPLLLSRAGRLVELTVRSGPDRDDAGQVRRVVVRPLRSEEELRYQDWVAGRRAEVAERSGGRLGYLHVPDMMAPGWAQLHRDLARETARDGLILDVRGNRGGHTSQLVVEKLARTVIGWDLPRHRAPSTYPEDAPRGPVVALADELSGSDGDIVTAAIKRLGIGPVIGVRTWGGVIGIDGRYGLVDGTRVTQPRYATWFDDSGWEMENYGVDPDEEVVIRPQDWVAGRDPQLDRAIELALSRLEQHPPARPPDLSTRPSRVRPNLPPRP